MVDYGLLYTHDVRRSVIPSLKPWVAVHPRRTARGVLLLQAPWVAVHPRRTARVCSFLETMGCCTPTTYGAQNFRRRTGKERKLFIHIYIDITILLEWTFFWCYMFWLFSLKKPPGFSFLICMFNYMNQNDVHILLFILYRSCCAIHVDQFWIPTYTCDVILYVWVYI